MCESQCVNTDLVKLIQYLFYFITLYFLYWWKMSYYQRTACLVLHNCFALLTLHCVLFITYDSIKKVEFTDEGSQLNKMCSTGTQTDDYGCIDGCTSVYFNFNLQNYLTEDRVIEQEVLSVSFSNCLTFMY